MNSISYKYPSDTCQSNWSFDRILCALFAQIEKCQQFNLRGVNILVYWCAIVRICSHKSRSVNKFPTRGLALTPSACPFSFFRDWICLLFTTCLLDLDLLGGSLFVAFCSCQLVTVDSKVKRNLKTENSELPRPSTLLITPMIEVEPEAIYVAVT